VEINHGYGNTFKVLLLYTLKTMLKKYQREKSTAVLGPGANVENPVLRLKPPVAEAATFGEDEDEDDEDARVSVEKIPLFLLVKVLV
jgi:hypothetical protein